MAPFAIKTGFGKNTHRAIAMGEVCEDIEKQHEDVKADTTIIIGEPQRVKLPFPCEEEIVHCECQLNENDDQECTDDISVTTHFNVLSLDLVGAAKKKKKGSTQAIGLPVQSPAPAMHTGAGAAKVDDKNMEEH